ncbi:MAG: VanZ family protein [Gemmatimonadetes bacterium]|nr:VanZ family protein [Gemmatimonadota bacterium]
MALKPRSRWGLPLTLASLAIIGWFTLRPSLDDAEAAARLPWTCLYPCGDYGLRDAVLNVALFVPLGLALAAMGHPIRALLLVFLTTVSVEFAQYHWLIGRDASLRDILTNSLGGGIGVLCAGAIGVAWSSRPPPQRLLRSRGCRALAEWRSPDGVPVAPFPATVGLLGTVGAGTGAVRPMGGGGARRGGRRPATPGRPPPEFGGSAGAAPTGLGAGRGPGAGQPPDARFCPHRQHLRQ